jgi:hypothetical protein
VSQPKLEPGTSRIQNQKRYPFSQFSHFHIAIFWFLTASFGLVGGYQLFGGTYYLHLQRRSDFYMAKLHLHATMMYEKGKAIPVTGREGP